MKFLKNHPFAVKAFFESSLVLTLAAPKEQLQEFIPECLELDTFQEKWAFLAVAMVQTKGLRPKGFPAFLGNDFFLIGYRIFVRFTNRTGKRLRGLYIIKSETNKAKMEFWGNIFTHYNYTTTDIRHESKGRRRSVVSDKSQFHVTISDQETETQIPLNSPFTDWKDARRFSGPLPFTFTYDPHTREVLVIEGVRQNWKPEPVNVVSYDFAFINSLHLNDTVLASAFEVRNTPYYWKKGKPEAWNPVNNQVLNGGKAQ